MYDITAIVSDLHMTVSLPRKGAARQAPLTRAVEFFRLNASGELFGERCSADLGAAYSNRAI